MKHPASTLLLATMILLGSTAFRAPLPAPPVTTTAFQPWVLMPWQPPVRREIAPVPVELRQQKRRDRWEKFAAEFGTARGAALPHLKHLANLKYTADVTLFTAKNALEQIEDFLEIRYSDGRIGRSATFTTPAPAAHHPSTFSLDDTRLKFDFAMAKGKPYLGVRLVIPFGN